MQVNIIKEDVENICRQHYGNKFSIEITEFFLKQCNENISGFLAQHCILRVTVKLNHQPSLDQESFFTKILPKHLPKQAEYIEGFCAFKKEVCLYEQLIPQLQAISLKRWAPNCYMTRNYDLIILENLTEMGYRMASGDDGTLDKEHLIVALKTLASLHASSIVMEKKSGQKLNDMYPDCLYENAYPLDPRMKIRQTGFENAIQVLSELIKFIPKYSQSYRDILPKFLQELKKIFIFCQPSTKFRNVFCHGDLWKNNVMFRYTESTDDGCEPVPKDAITVDYQLSRYTPPALDVLSFITITTNSDFRLQHLESLLNGYYSNLTMELKHFQIDIEAELPKLEFERSCKYFQLAALIENCLFNHLVLLPNSLVSNLMSTSENFGNFIVSNQRLTVCCKAFNIDANYRHRLTDTLTCIIDGFILK